MSDKERKILLYMSEDGKVTVDVRFEDETFWVTQKAMGELFDTEFGATNMPDLMLIFHGGIIALIGIGFGCAIRLVGRRIKKNSAQQ